MSRVEQNRNLLSVGIIVNTVSHEGGVDIIDHRYHPSEKKMRNTARRLGMDLLGCGQDCFVLASRNLNDASVVLSVYYQGTSPRTVESLYHRQNILNLLLPHNFPKFYGVIEIPPAANEKFKINTWGILRQRIHGEFRDRYLWENAVNFAHRDRKSTYPFAYAWKTMMDLELPFLPPDPGPNNFILGEDGGVYYVDVSHLKHNQNHLVWNTTKIIDHMRTFGSNSEDTCSVLDSIKHLETDP